VFLLLLGIKRSIDVIINIKIKVMSDSVKKYYELVEEGVINKDIKVPSSKKAFRILTEYDIKDIKKAVEIYDNQLK
jgi:hypothetical protein|tara:strand:- start:68 stop:295 length:228 start_codon:yes stop_codon:yes gene_type:complete